MSPPRAPGPAAVAGQAEAQWRAALERLAAVGTVHDGYQVVPGETATRR